MDNNTKTGVESLAFLGTLMDLATYEEIFGSVPRDLDHFTLGMFQERKCLDYVFQFD